MLRKGVDAGPRAKHGRRAVAPASLRVVLLALLTGGVSGLVGGANGFWLGLPGVLLAGTIGSSGPAALSFSATLLLVDLGAASLAPGSLPPIWLVVLVPTGCLMVLHGMGRRLRRERDLFEQAAFSDPLTGLANRRMLLSVAEHEIARHRRAQERFTVVMLDLDGFKLLNDRFGHAAGDQMLCDVAVALSQALRAQDTIARLGGDEFCVIAPSTANPHALADKVAAAVGQAARLEELRTSVGIALFPEDGSTIESLLRTADERLLSAKRRLHGTSGRRAA